MSQTLPNMTLVIPTVGNPVVPDGGPGYAQEINQALTLIDAHDHSSGKGVPVTQNGLNITGNLPFAGFAVTNLGYVNFGNQSAALSTTRALYNVNGELYWTDGSGNQVKITASGAVNTGATGNLSGMDGSAAVTYSAITKTFTFTQSSAFPAKVAHGDLQLFETVAAAAQVITVKVPAGLANTFSITLPGAVPATNALAQFSTAAVMSFLAAPVSTGILQSTSAGVLSYNTAISALFDASNNFQLGVARVGPAGVPSGTIGYGPIGSNLQVFTAPPPTLVQGAGTVTNGGPGGAIRLIFAAAHGLREGEAVQMSSTVTLPTNISASTTYIVTLDASAPTLRINLYPVPTGWLYTVPLITAASPAGLTFGALLAFSATGSGTLTVTPGWVAPPLITRTTAQGVGGGSGGSGGATNSNSGGGGGAGAYSKGKFTVIPGTFYPMSVGSGGAGGAAGSVGIVGVATTFFGISLNPGVAAPSFTYQAGLGGAAGTGGIVNTAGGDGDVGQFKTGSTTGPTGGASFYGDGGTGSDTNTAGIAARAPGSGGGGGGSTGASQFGGGAGANGIIEVEW